MLDPRTRADNWATGPGHLPTPAKGIVEGTHGLVQAPPGGAITQQTTFTRMDDPLKWQRPLPA